MNIKVIKLYKSKVETTQITVDKKGVVGDKYHDKEVNRSLLIASQDSYNLAYKHNIDINNGALGENILIDYNPYSLPIGTKLKIGEVILEITQHCTICNSLSKVDKNLPSLLKNDRGIFAKVIKSGYIKIDDKVFIEEI